MPDAAYTALDTLHLTHSHKRRSSRQQTRSPSPFMTTPPPQSPVDAQLLRKRQPVHRPSGLTTQSYPNGNANGAAVTNGHAANGHNIPNGVSEAGEAHDEDAEVDRLLAPSQPKDAVKKIDWEIPRKTLHSSIGFLVLPLYISHHPVKKVIIGLAVALAFVSTNDIIRFNSTTFERWYERVVGFLMRESEKHKINGVVWYLIGVIYVLSCLPLDIAVVAILMLSWADTTASTFGRLYGSRTRQLPTSIPLPFTSYRLPLFAPKKSVAGFTAAVITGSLITGVFYSVGAPLGVDEPSWVFGKGLLGNWPGLAVLTVFGGLVAGIAEALNVGSLDDNLTLPVISGTAIYAFFKAVQYFS